VMGVAGIRLMNLNLCFDLWKFCASLRLTCRNHSRNSAVCEETLRWRARVTGSDFQRVLEIRAKPCRPSHLPKTPNLRSLVRPLLREANYAGVMSRLIKYGDQKEGGTSRFFKPKPLSLCEANFSVYKQILGGLQPFLV